MPRNVRNFWIELNIDGRKTRIATGPRKKNGGFFCTIYMREDGDVTRAIQIEGFSRNSDSISLRVDDAKNHIQLLNRFSRR